MVGENVPLMVWALHEEGEAPDFLFKTDIILGPDGNYHMVIDQTQLPLAIEQMLDYIGDTSDR